MQFALRLILPLLLLFFSGVPVLAQNGSWTVSEAKGGVVVIDARGQRPARAGTELAAGDTIRTGAGASAVIVRGREFVTMRQNAQLRIPQRCASAGLCRSSRITAARCSTSASNPTPISVSIRPIWPRS